MKPEEENKIPEQSAFIKQMLEVEIFPNLSQQVIMTTEDRLKLCLQENLKKAEKKHDWLTPFSLLVAIITTFATADFKDVLLSAKTWEAIFILGGVASLIWFGFSLKNAFQRIDISEIIEDIKTNAKSSK